MVSVPLCSKRLGVLLGMISKSSFGDSGFLVAFIFHETKIFGKLLDSRKKTKRFLKRQCYRNVNAS